MLDDQALVSVIYTVGGTVFLGGFVIGALTTLARVVYYFLHRVQRPRLLNRDIVVWGGLALSFAQIAAVRFLPLDVRTQLTAGNVGWALSTTLPAVIAVVTYCYYELWVIERTKDEGDPLALEASLQTIIELTREGIVASKVAASKSEEAIDIGNHSREALMRLTEIVGGKEDKAP